jgi:2,4-dienoyl-CoA reductase-like NADH-dependent reductase (Old Yellow Enzyme family)
MATEDGRVTPDLVAFYSRLARGGAGLIVTGHVYVDRRGQYAPFQTGIDSDDRIAGWQELVAEVHRHGGRIFAELAHAGSQSVVPGNLPVAPSVVPNAIYDTEPEELSAEAIETLVAAFGAAAGRAMQAGFDGIHIHGGNGYLISQFLSPLANRRTDRWGGDAEGRWRFLAEILRAVRAATGPDVPVTARIGVADSAPGGLTLEESVARVAALRAEGLDAVEPVYAVMRSYEDNVRPYVGVGAGRALADWAVERLWRPAAPEAYYRDFARALKAALPEMPVILIGGLRSTGVMEEVLTSGEADFLAMARPFVREPDLPAQIAAGRRGRLDCVSCNLCLMHEGRHGLRCWRRTTRDLVAHVRTDYLGGRP